MGNTLTKQLTNIDRSEREEDSSSLAAFIKALGIIQSKEDIDQKSHLSDENIHGIMIGLSWNDYLERNLGFRLSSLDTFIAEKLLKSISLDRMGRNELIELFRAMKLELEGSNVETIGNRMIVARR
jgi:hypothetical protein